MEDNLKIDNSNQQSDISHILTGNGVVAELSEIDKILEKKGLFYQRITYKKHPSELGQISQTWVPSLHVFF